MHIIGKRSKTGCWQLAGLILLSAAVGGWFAAPAVGQAPAGDKKKDQEMLLVASKQPGLGEQEKLRRQLIDQALASYQKIAQGKDDSPAGLKARAWAQKTVGDLRSAQGKLAEGLDNYRKAIAIQTKLVGQFPDKAEYRQDLAFYFVYLLNACNILGRPVEAEEAGQRALELQMQLAKQYPTKASYRRELAGTYYRVADQQYLKDKLALAKVSCEKAAKLLQELVKMSPDERDYQMQLATTNTLLVAVLQKHGQHAAAVEPLRKAVFLWEKLVANYSQDSIYRHELIRTYDSMATLLTDLGRKKEAEQFAQKAKELKK